MKRVAGGLALAAGLLVLAPAARAADAGEGKAAGDRTETERRLEEVLAELEAQRMEINALKAKMAAMPAPVEGGVDAEIQKYLESEAGKKSLFDAGFARTGIGSLKIGGLFQFYYTSQRSVNPAGTGAKTGVDTFRVRRAELIFSGSVVKDEVDYFVMIDPARDLGNDETAAPTKRILQDFKLVYRGPFGVPKDIVLTVGQFKFPFSREGFTTPTSRLDFINRADATGILADQRRPGAMVQGTLAEGAFEWFANVHGTRGQNSIQDNNDEKNWVVRGIVNPMKFGGGDEAKARVEKWGDLSVGASTMKGVETDAHLDTKRYGCDAEWRKKKVFTEKDGVFLRTEYLRADNNVLLADNKRGHYYAAGYAINDDWELVARHDEFRDRAAGPSDNRTDTLGVNYFIKGHNAKIDLNYIRNHPEIAGAKSLFAQWILQFQVAF